jgi:hypothetical protein
MSGWTDHHEDDADGDPDGEQPLVGLLAQALGHAPARSRRGRQHVDAGEEQHTENQPDHSFPPSFPTRRR